MYISLLLFVTIICFSMVLKSMKKPEFLFVYLEYNINSIKCQEINEQPFALMCGGAVACIWF